MWHHAQELLAHGQSVIRSRAAGYRIALHYLGVPHEQLEKRLATRSGSVTITRDLQENYAMPLQAPTIEELALFDPPREV